MLELVQQVNPEVNEEEVEEALRVAQHRAAQQTLQLAQQVNVNEQDEEDNYLEQALRLVGMAYGGGGREEKKADGDAEEEEEDVEGWDSDETVDYMWRQEEEEEELPSVEPEEPGWFECCLQPFIERQSRRMGVRKRHYVARMQQHGQLQRRQQLNAELVEAMHRAILNLIEESVIPDGDRVYMGMASNRLNKNWNYRGLSAGEWQRGGGRVEELLQQMSRILNSNEDFQPDDSFQLSFTHVLHSVQGSGKRKQKSGHSHPETFKRLKSSVVTIKGNDGMCAARALVTAKALVDKDSRYRYFRDGGLIQTRAAIGLHEEVKLAAGPCGFEELRRLMLAPSLYDYQVLLIDATRGYSVTSHGPPREKQLLLLYARRQYDMVRSLPGFFASNHFYARYFKAYAHEGHHRCTNNPDHCKACLKTGCPDFTEAKARGQRAAVDCEQCHRRFFGPKCLEQHVTKNYLGQAPTEKKPTDCLQRRKCGDSFKLLVGVKAQRDHLCGYVSCPCCKEYVEGASHKCFIQKAKTPAQEKEEKRAKRDHRARCGAAAGLATLEANEAGMEETVTAKDEEEEKPPLHVFFDIEAMQDTGRHVANLVVAGTEEDDRPVRFKGGDCLKDFVQWLDTLTDNDQRSVTVVAHNFQGYDGYFVVNEYHRQNPLLKFTAIIAATVPTKEYVEEKKKYQIKMLSLITRGTINFAAFCLLIDSVLMMIDEILDQEKHEEFY